MVLIYLPYDFVVESYGEEQAAAEAIRRNDKKHKKTTMGKPSPKESDSKRVERVHVYLPKFSAGSKHRGIRLYHVFFLVLYVYQIYWCASTVGQPYRKFLEKAEKEGFQGKYE